jgi:hypothetical protein
VRSLRRPSFARSQEGRRTARPPDAPAACAVSGACAESEGIPAQLAPSSPRASKRVDDVRADQSRAPVTIARIRLAAPCLSPAPRGPRRATPWRSARSRRGPAASAPAPRSPGTHSSLRAFSWCPGTARTGRRAGARGPRSRATSRRDPARSHSGTPRACAQQQAARRPGDGGPQRERTPAGVRVCGLAQRRSAAARSACQWRGCGV